MTLNATTLEPVRAWPNWCQRDGCGEPAMVELVDRRDQPRGQFCVTHGCEELNALEAWDEQSAELARFRAEVAP